VLPLALAALVALAGCGGAGGEEARLVREPVVDAAASAASDTTAVAAPAAPVPETTAPPAAPPPEPAPPPTGAPVVEPPPIVPPAPRVVHTPEWGTPFATAAGLTLVHPAAAVERVGFHESNHDGAQTFVAAPTAAAPVELESRERDTAPNSAADIVVDPEGEIRAPVSGVVKRSGGYILYCRHRDDYVVIAPDGQPDLEVKVLHINGVQVAPGQRVEAGQTVLAPRPTQLPFESQVDETTASPAWPHVHLEVVDPRIKDRPSPGGGC
jgi:biotin carboxyl carrier protein